MLAFLIHAAWLAEKAFASDVRLADIIINSPGTTVNVPNPLNTTNLATIAERIAEGLFVVAIPIVSIMVLYGGFLIMTSGGNEERMKSGRKTIIYAAVGFLVVFLSSVIATIIQSVIDPSRR